MAGATPELSGILNAILENPDALSGIAGLLGGLARAPTGKGAAPPEEGEHPAGEESEAVDTALSSLPPPRSPGRERGLLLDALCPYLSPPRRRALEGARRLLEVWELFGRRG